MEWNPTIVIDTREQKPYEFEDVKTITGTLPTGDYSIQGCENNICIERKSLQDLYQTLTWGRDRFKKELERMQEFDEAYLLVEASWATVWIGPKYSKANPKSIVASLISFIRRTNVKVIMAGGRKDACKVAQMLLEQYWKDKKKEELKNELVES